MTRFGPSSHDPVDVLREEMRALARTVSPPSGFAERLVADLGDDRAASKSRRQRPRLRRRLILVGCGGLLLAGCVVVATVLRGQPDLPELGIACLASTEPGADIVATRADADPIQACAEVWSSGRLPDPDNPTDAGTVPPLTACVGNGGVVEVYPHLDDCEALGLEPAMPLSADNQRVLDLEEAVADLNVSSCLTVDAARNRFESLLDNYGMNGWTVEGSPMASTSDCVKGQIDSAKRTVLLFSL